MNGIDIDKFERFRMAERRAFLAANPRVRRAAIGDAIVSTVQVADDLRRLSNVFSPWRPDVEEYAEDVVRRVFRQSLGVDLVNLVDDHVETRNRSDGLVVVALDGRELDVVVDALGRDALRRLCECEESTGFECKSCKKFKRIVANRGGDWVEIGDRIAERLGRWALSKILKRTKG